MSARYSSRPLPSYTHVPGTGTVHPTRHPDGHSYGVEEDIADFVLGAWAGHEHYRFGIDLHNQAFHWECHEVLEGVWRTVPRRSEPALFLQALIQLTVAHSYVIRGRPDVSRKLAGWARDKLPDQPSYAGMDLGPLRDAIDQFIADPQRRVAYVLQL